MDQQVADYMPVLELYLRMDIALRDLDTLLQQGGAGLAWIDWRALGFVLTQGPVSLKQVADSLGVAKTSLHYTMHTLQAAGLIARAGAGPVAHRRPGVAGENGTLVPVKMGPSAHGTGTRRT